MEFKRGEFQPFRATDQVHLGSIETNIAKDEVVMFDGMVAKIAGHEHSIPALKGAIKEGWFVPESDTTSTRQVKAAGVTVRPADAADRASDRTMTMATVEDDERAVSTVADAKLGYRQDQPVEVQEGDDGVAVSKIRTSAKQSTKVTDPQAAAKAIRDLDNKPPPKAEAVATGDVQETIVGEDLEELLPDAASTKKPAPGKAGEGDQPHMTAEERAEYARKARLAQFGESEAVSEETPEEPVKTSELDQKLAIIRMSIPDFEWDLSVQWAKRAKAAVAEHGDNPLYLNSILAIETDAVKKDILKRMAER
jgi:hypothetical protein